MSLHCATGQGLSLCVTRMWQRIEGSIGCLRNRHQIRPLEAFGPSSAKSPRLKPSGWKSEALWATIVSLGE